MYQIIYYNGSKQETYDYLFNTIWGAIFKARCITESFGFSTDVIGMQYGEVLASFSSNGKVYADSDLPNDIKKLIYTPIR